MNHGGPTCISFGGMRVDRAVGDEVVERLQPLGVETALAALELRGHEAAEKRRQLDLALEQARYEVARARRQYDAVDPDNRLVAAELERRWNEALRAAQALEQERDAAAAHPPAFTAPQRQALLDLGADVSRAWRSPGATPQTRKRILRTVIDEIVACVQDDALDLTIRWQGGDHTQLRVRKNRVGQHRWSTGEDVAELICALARQMPDRAIASLLNRAGKKTSKGLSWNRSHVCVWRNHRRIAPYREGERSERGEATLDEAVVALKVSESTVRRLIADKALPARQACKGAPWTILIEDLRRDDVRRAADARRLRRPPSDDALQNVLTF
jgi:hypothetical protein